MEKSPLIESARGDCFLIDTPAIRKVACHPHIVSEQLASLCLDTAKEFSAALKELKLISDDSGILHILRGSSGYMVDKALPELPVINIRTKYSEDGYRAHTGDSRRIEVAYSDYHASEYNTLIIPDTYATGRSVETALRHLFDQEISVDSVVIYGFIAVPGIERVYQLLSQKGVKLSVVAICDITQLYYNNYDMPLYGLDEHLYKQSGLLRSLGSIVSNDTLHDMVNEYIPGMDQPGDWSERHSSLFNGYSHESGDIQGHISKSIDFIESLDKLNSSQSWYNEHIHELTQKEIIELKSSLRNL